VERVAFWDSSSTHEWFRQRGYTLYAHNEVEHDTIDFSDPALRCEPSCEMRFPYSHYDSEGYTKTPLRAKEPTVSSPHLLWAVHLTRH
jgi:hypothetical protein